MSVAPKVSVIVAAYNAERFIWQCLDSVLAQTMPDFEVVVVNDGSEDATSEIVESYASRDRRIHVIHKENGGVSTARNRGLAEAKGEWVFFLDADDRLKPDAFSRMLDKSADADGVFGGYEVYDSEHNRTYFIEDDIECEMDKYQALEQMFRPWYYRYYGYTWGKLFKMSVIREARLHFDEHIVFNEDRLFTVEYLCKVNKIAYFTVPVYEYVEHSASAMGSLSKAYNPKFLTDLDAFLKMKKEVKKLPEGKKILPLLKHSAGESFRRISQMMRQNNVKGIFPRIWLYVKISHILTAKEFWEDAILPLLHRHNQS